MSGNVEKGPFRQLTGVKIQVFLYLPSCSIAGIVVMELQFRFPEAELDGHEPNKPRVFEWVERDCGVPKKRGAHGATL
jgi:hypothetical protein